MKGFDLKKVPIGPENPNHSRHKAWRANLHRSVSRHRWWRVGWSGLFFVFGVVFVASALMTTDGRAGEFAYVQQSEVQKVRASALARFTVLPVEQNDPKLDTIVQYLSEKKSPLAAYAGIISRMEHWKLILGIAQAESNFCKKTDKNNCWGIGPGRPFAYEDIAESLYHVNYLLENYYSVRALTAKPETMVRTYVGYQNPTWVAAIKDVYHELGERGLK